MNETADSDNRKPSQPTLTGLRRVLHRCGAGVTVPILLYLIFVIAGVTTSSLGHEFLRQDPAHPYGLMIGTPQVVRSDEFLRDASSQLGVMAAGETLTSPLAEAGDILTQIPGSDIAENVVFFDAAILKLGPVLPDSMLFAAYRWFAILLFVLFCPMWLTSIGAGRRPAWFGTAIIALCPATIWWSFVPIKILGWTVAGCFLLIVAARNWQKSERAKAVVAAAVGGFLLVRMVTNYVPWSLTLSVPVALATAVWLIWQRDRRVSGFMVLAIGGAVAIVSLVALYWQNLAALKSQLATIYPGQRRWSGRALSAGEIAGAPDLAWLSGTESLISKNASEISSGFTFALLWVLVLILARRSLGTGRDSAALWTLAIITFGWLSWTLLPWGNIGSHLPVINLVDPLRVAQTIGIPAVLLLVLALSRWDRPIHLRVPVVSALVCATLTLWGGLSLRHMSMPDLHLLQIAISALVVAGAVFAVTAFPGHLWPQLAVVAVLTASAITVHPWIFGLGDLRESPSAQRMLGEGALARTDNELWISNSVFDDTFFAATGTPQLGGAQMAGPRRDEWAKLDPTGNFEENWNRGASLIQFAFTQGPDINITNPSPDTILVFLDPCTLPARGFEVTHVLSAVALANSCLIAEAPLQWLGIEQFVYQVSPS